MNVIAREYSVLLLSWAFCFDAPVEDCNIFDRFPIKERRSNAVAHFCSAYAALSPNPPTLNLKMKM